MPIRLLGTILTAVLLVGCGGGSEPAADGSTSADDAVTPADDATTPAAADTTTAAATAADEPPAAPVSEASCGEPATPVGLGTPVDGTAEDGESVYFCVEVPPGQSAVTFTLDGMTADLDLFVAHDTFEDLEGGLGLRFSDDNGTDPDEVRFEPSAYRGELLGFDTYADVSPGPYWIEVVGAASTFTLTVTGEPV